MSSLACGEERRRLLVDLCHVAPRPEAFSATAELAQLLRRELVGIYVEDEALRQLAALPFARELQMPAQAWSRLEAARLDAECHGLAHRLHRLLEQHGSRLGVPSRFELVRGDPAGFVAGHSAATDIVTLGAPGDPGGRALGSFRAAWRAAMEAPAATLLLPSRIGRRRGSVAVLLGRDGGARAAAAVALAAAAGEDVLALLEAPDVAPWLPDIVRAAGLDSARLRVTVLAGATPEELVRALAGGGQRLLMLDRRLPFAPGIEEAARLSEALGVPLLFD